LARLKPFKEEAWAIGLRQGETELRARVNQFLTQFRADGGFERLGNRYLKEEKEAFQKLGIPFFF
jgi:polar amino acid transport system substrate-binding protein